MDNFREFEFRPPEAPVTPMPTITLGRYGEDDGEDTIPPNATPTSGMNLGNQNPPSDRFTSDEFSQSLQQVKTPNERVREGHRAITNMELDNPSDHIYDDRGIKDNIRRSAEGRPAGLTRAERNPTPPKTFEEIQAEIAAMSEEEVRAKLAETIGMGPLGMGVRAGFTAWTADKIDKLKNLIADGKTYSQIGEMFGVTKNAIAQQVKELGIPGGARGPGASTRAGATERSNRVSELVEEGLTDPQIATELGLARTSVSKIRSRLGLDSNSSAGRPTIQTEERIAKVREMFADGSSDAEIAKAVNTSIKTVQNMRLRAGLSRRSAAEPTQEPTTRAEPSLPTSRIDMPTLTAEEAAAARWLEQRYQGQTKGGSRNTPDFFFEPSSGTTIAGGGVVNKELSTLRDNSNTPTPKRKLRVIEGGKKK